MNKAPEFWRHDCFSLWPVALSPISWLYNFAASTRARMRADWKAPVPVICIGNLTMGGAGKTPSAIAIAKYLKENGKNPFFLSRGFGGHMKGPLIVGTHSTHEVGDEPLLLKQVAPVCISTDRVAGARLCVKKGADVILMDDGFQNPHLHKDISLIVIDGGFGHGNELVFPAGPLRESLASGLRRAHAVLLIGQDKTEALRRIRAIRPDLPIIEASIIAQERPDLKNKKLLAFAGIGRPEKFFDTLRTLECNLVDCVGFPDHHPFLRNDIRKLKEKAKDLEAQLITTEKDYMRLPKEYAKDVDTLKIRLVWKQEDMVKAVLSQVTD